MKALILAMCLLCSLVVQAADIELTWNAPTTREDGAALSPSDIAGYEIHAKYPNGTTTIIEVPATETSYSVAISTSGRYAFTILTVDTDSLRSAPSGEVSANIASRSAPSTIEGVQLNIVCRAGAVCHFYDQDALTDLTNTFKEPTK